MWIWKTPKNNTTWHKYKLTDVNSLWKTKQMIRLGVDHQRVQTKQSRPSRLDRWKLTKYQSFGSQKFAQTMDQGAGWGERKKGQSGTKGWAGATGSRPATEQTGISDSNSLCPHALAHVRTWMYSNLLVEHKSTVPQSCLPGWIHLLFYSPTCPLLQHQRLN